MKQIYYFGCRSANTEGESFNAKIKDYRSQLKGVVEKKGTTELNFQLSLAADSEGFEPPVPCGTVVFKTTAFDHSANYPNGCKNRTDLCICKCFHKKHYIFFISTLVLCYVMA